MSSCVKVGEETMICRRDSHLEIAHGDKQRLVAKPNRIHLFDCETDVNLSLPAD